jgi:hypothetical protein
MVGLSIDTSMHLIRRLRPRQRLKSAANSLLLRITHAPGLHCLGDSHAAMFQTVAKRHFWWHTRFAFCIVQGATATGLANPNSQTQAYPIFQKYLRSISAQNDLLFCLGEVDCGFVIWYRAEKYGESIDSQMALATQRYSDLIKEAMEMGFRNITICSTPLPTILDGQDWGEVANKRKEISANLIDRTRLTLKFNAAMRSFAAEQGLKYMNLDAVLYDPSTGILRDEFRNRNRLDHHLDPERISKEIITMLNALGYY